jgi:hypothetical protein
MFARLKGTLMNRIAMGIAALWLCAAGAATAGNEKIVWTKLDTAQQLASTTGKPILVYAGFT